MKWDKVIAGLILMLVLFISTAPVSAEDGIVCAAIYPCNSDGTVQAPFDQGACASHYARGCTGKLYNRMQDKIITCEQNNDNLLQDIRNTRKKMRRLRFQRKRSR